MKRKYFLIDAVFAVNKLATVQADATQIWKLSKRSIFKSCIVCLTVFLVLVAIPAQGQKWLDNISNTIDKVSGAADKADVAGRKVGKVVKTVKSITWKKDNSPNIRYEQVPDYKTQAEVGVSKKQKLQVENGSFKNLQWTPEVKFEKQLFPSFIIGWANYRGNKYEDMGNSLGFSIKTTLPNVVLKWEIECTDKSFFSIDSGYINCDHLKSGKDFMPRISWDYRNLTKHYNNAPVNVYFRLTDPNSGARVEKLVTINMRSIYDCLLYINETKTDYLFASYVNEDYAEIDNILRDMLNTKMIDFVGGYQDDSMAVHLQVAALWRVLHDKGFQYSSITDNSGNDKSSGIFSQTVRTIDQSLKTKQANCVDGTVLMASILRKMGIHPVLVSVPGHCFLGYYTNKSKSWQSLYFLETTMMSDDKYIKNTKDVLVKYKSDINYFIPGKLKLSDVNKAYYLQYASALSGGQKSYKNAKEKYGENSITLIDVGEYRSYIKPIPIYQ